MQVAQWTKDVAALWKAFSDEEKRPYEKLAAADKERYDKDVANYLGHSIIQLEVYFT